MDLQMGSYQLRAEDGMYEVLVYEVEGKDWKSLGTFPRFSYAFLDLIERLQNSAAHDSLDAYGASPEWLTKLGALTEMQSTLDLLEDNLSDG